MKRKMYTIKEAAQLIDGINEFRIRQMCRSGQLRTFKAGKKFLIAESDLYDAARTPPIARTMRAYKRCPSD